jgi:hypothetical protein
LWCRRDFLVPITPKAGERGNIFFFTTRLLLPQKCGIAMTEKITAMRY